MTEVPGWLYFVGDLGRSKVVKIGWTGQDSWRTRFYHLQSTYPFVLTPLLVIPGTLHEEATILFRFREFKTKPGTGEWFRAAPSLMVFIDWLAGRHEANLGPHRMAHLLGRPNQVTQEAVVAGRSVP